MADFLKAIQDGVRAAELAERARTEIDQVFDELNKQMQAFSNGKVFIGRLPFPVIDQYGEPVEDGRGDVETELGIGLHTSNKKRQRWLAQWISPHSGYPCRIRTDQLILTCDDKPGLEASLSEVLRDPKVGEAVQQLMSEER